MRDEDYALIEHPRLELHFHVATKFVQVVTINDYNADKCGNIFAYKSDVLPLIVVFVVLQLGSLAGLTLVGPIVNKYLNK